MNHQIVIPHDEYGVFAQVTYDFDRGEDIILSTRVEVSASPCAEITFWLDRAKHHHGQASYVLSGGVSPQSQERESHHQAIAKDLYERHATLQKRMAHSPVAQITQCLLGLSMPNEQTASYIQQSPMAKETYLKQMDENVMNALVLYNIIARMKEISVASAYPDDVKAGAIELRRSLVMATRAHQQLSGSPGLKIKVMSSMPAFPYQEKEAA